MSQPINGLLLIDKPANCTSHDIVAQVRKVIGQKAVGHTGTLDPLATGLMVMVIGEATKLSDYLTGVDKLYQLRVKLGVTTDTLDKEGKVLSETACDLNPEVIRRAVEALEGEFEWPVPLFSAAKVDGKKLYEYGRSQQEVERPIKLMTFWRPEVLSLGANFVELTLACSKGSFMRSWADELGRRLGVGGIVESLRRLAVGGWRVEHAITIDRMIEEGCGSSLIPMGQALPGLKSIVAGPKEARLVLHGQIPRDMMSRLVFEQKQAIREGEPVFIKVLTPPGELLAILAAEPTQGLKIRRVFQGFA